MMKKGSMHNRGTSGGPKMSVMLSSEDPNIKRVAGQGLQRRRLELEDQAGEYESLYAKFKQMESEYVKDNGEDKLAELGLPPAPTMRRRLKPAAILEEHSVKTFDDGDLPAFKVKLESEGFNVTKHGRKGKPHPRRLWITRDNQRLNVSDQSGMSSKGLDVRELLVKLQNDGNLDLTIMNGYQTKVFERSQQFAHDETHCFSIQGKSRSFDFECEAEEDRDYIVSGLKLLVETAYNDLQAAD